MPLKEIFTIVALSVSVLCMQSLIMIAVMLTMDADALLRRSKVPRRDAAG
ncbi:hypothetical protein QTI66_13785 [Variovorax sp. J22R133]|nr:hypothetical protein [Variovorax sp. J22R133]MDM0113224.1 hypothetical protein [Variovorax sp. J22R133]